MTNFDAIDLIRKTFTNACQHFNLDASSIRLFIEPTVGNRRASTHKQVAGRAGCDREGPYVQIALNVIRQFESDTAISAIIEIVEHEIAHHAAGLTNNHNGAWAKKVFERGHIPSQYVTTPKTYKK